MSIHSSDKFLPLKKSLSSYFHSQGLILANDQGDYLLPSLEGIRSFSVLGPNPLGKYKKLFWLLRFRRPLQLLAVVEVMAPDKIKLAVYGQESWEWGKKQSEKLKEAYPTMQVVLAKRSLTVVYSKL